MRKVNIKNEKKSEEFPYRDIGNRLKWAFREKKLVKLEQQTGISKSSWSRYFRGEFYPSEEILNIVRDRGYSANYILWGVGDPILSIAEREGLTFNSDEEMIEYLRNFPDRLLVAALRQTQQPTNPTAVP